MKLNAEQYARLFKAMSGNYWSTPPLELWRDLGEALYRKDHKRNEWHKHLLTMGVHKADRTWEDMSNDQDMSQKDGKIEFCPIYEKPTTHSWPHKFIVAGQNNKNILLTDPSSDSKYIMHEHQAFITFEPFLVERFSTTFDEHRRYSKDILLIPMETAEKILVLGVFLPPFPEQPELE